MEPRKTRLYAWHASQDARFTTFGGWTMPLSYPTGTVAEHFLTRRSAGLFDIDHMGRFRVTGKDAESYLESTVSSSIGTLPPGSSRYALLCRDDGGIIDDLFVYRDTKGFLIVVNAARREVDFAWMTSHVGSHEVHLTDVSDETYMVALQGPRAVALLERALGVDLSRLERFGFTRLSWNGGSIEVGRTGYTGEDGVELFFPDAPAPALWEHLIETGRTSGIEVGPVGLAARDTLRLEAGFALYGHEISESVSPVEARLTWACDLDGPDWTGRDAVLRRKSENSSRRLIRFEVTGRGVPRAGHTVVDESGAVVGKVVSGTKGPTVGRFIGNAFVDVRAENGKLGVEIRGKTVPIARHKGPFYRSTYRTVPPAAALMERSGEYRDRHIGPREADVEEMVRTVGARSLSELIDTVVPADIRLRRQPKLPEALSEDAFADHIRSIAAENEVFRSLIGQGYHDTITPPVIRRTIFENPSWYTQYTPYQAEISQGRMEALLNFQTMITELTGMDVANSSMLDEATAAGEAMFLTFRARKRGSASLRFLVDRAVHPQTIAHLETRAAPWKIRVERIDAGDAVELDGAFGLLLQYPDTFGAVRDYREFAAAAGAAGVLVVAAADPLSLTLLEAPGDWGADIVVGTTQRFGVPLGFGGPHAAFFATRNTHRRLLPGRIVGLSTDAEGRPAARLALQTREQHIRRERATSNICTAQVLLAVMASMYAVYHGPEGLTRIAHRVRLFAEMLRAILGCRGLGGGDAPLFDTVSVTVPPDRADTIRKRAEASRFNFRFTPGDNGVIVSIAFDERTNRDEVARVAAVITEEPVDALLEELDTLAPTVNPRYSPGTERTTSFLDQGVFHDHRSETAILRYITSLQERDLSLANSMIPLGSCTMKLNPAAAIEPVSWPEFASLHPFAPADQARGYRRLVRELSQRLSAMTGLPGCTLQPNSGAQGEYTGLLIIRSYHLSRGEANRTVCLVPDSAHGTNPASAVMAGMDVVVIRSTSEGDIDLDDLARRAEEHADELAALMITYPSTHGVFEASVQGATEIVHRYGGQVYMDGANFNAQLGLTSPAAIGADVCHLNLHKTFAIPHGGGGPGVGPVLVADHLVPYLPGTVDDPGVTGVVVAAPYGSASILPISYGYIAMMGAGGLRRASETAILNANYLASRLAPHYRVAFRGLGGFVAHECVLDFRELERETGVTVEDVAKRLMDYGFHAPTMSWPLQGSLMVEPTESENRAELDRFTEAMIAIRREIDSIAAGEIALEESPLRNAPHTLASVTGPWDRPYSRHVAAFPAPWLRERKFWPAVARVDNVAGDKNLVCSCAPLEAYRGASP